MWICSIRCVQAALERLLWLKMWIFFKHHFFHGWFSLDGNFSSLMMTVSSVGDEVNAVCRDLFLSFSIVCFQLFLIMSSESLLTTVDKRKLADTNSLCNVYYNMCYVVLEMINIYNFYIWNKNVRIRTLAYCVKKLVKGLLLLNLTEKKIK